MAFCKISLSVFYALKEIGHANLIKYQEKHRKTNEGYGWAKLEKIKMDGIWIYLKKLAQLFLMFIIIIIKVNYNYNKNYPRIL